MPVVPDFHSFRFVTPVDATTDANTPAVDCARPASRHILRIRLRGDCDDPSDLFRGWRSHAARRFVVSPPGSRTTSVRPLVGRKSTAATDWERFYHYPYVYYPQNFWGNEYYRSADSLYYRYPAEMRIPVYNRHWFNEYPTPRPYYRGAHFVLDIF